MKKLAPIGAVLLAFGASLGPSSQADSTGIALGHTVRITTPGTSLCPAEGEPETTVTSMGIWVGYNDDHVCPLTPSQYRFTGLQLIPANGSGPKYVEIQPRATDSAFGDPDLAPDPSGDGSIYLASLWTHPGEGALSLRILHVDTHLHVKELPTPSLHQQHNSDDKEFIATDSGRNSPWHGRLYVAWDDFLKTTTVLRAWDGHHWTHPAVLQHAIGAPDVAVAPNGDVAVGFENPTGAAVRISHDGGRRFDAPIQVFAGGSPGSFNPSCPLRPSIGTRQRAMRGVRVTYDTDGTLHVVAAMGDVHTSAYALPDSAAAATGVAVVKHAVVRRGQVRSASAVTALSTDEQWAAAIAPLPHGGVAVAWLQTSDPGRTSYDAWLAVLRRHANRFSPPVRLSPASSTFPSGTEAVGNSSCYGVGDYIGIATTANGVVTVWPTTTGTQPAVDSDVLARTARVS